MCWKIRFLCLIHVVLYIYILVQRGLTANKESEKSNGNIDKKYFIGYLKKYIYIYQSSPLHIFFSFFQNKLQKPSHLPKKIQQPQTPQIQFLFIDFVFLSSSTPSSKQTHLFVLTHLCFKLDYWYLAVVFMICLYI